MVIVRTPTWYNNDEVEHVKYVEAILRTGALPSISLDNGIESHQAPLFYLLAAGWQRLFGLPVFVPPSTPTEMLSDGLTIHATWLAELRLLSALCGLVAVAATFVAAWLLTSRVTWATAAAAALALWPKFVVTSAAVTNSSLVGALCAVSLALLMFWRHRPTLLRAVVVGVALGAAVLAQVTALPVVAAVVVAMWWRRRFLDGLVTGGVVALASGWWFLSNAQKYGDPLATAATNDYLRDAFGPAYVLIRPEPSLAPDVLGGALSILGRSVWFDAGWNDVHFPWWVDLVVGVVGVVCLVMAVLRRGDLQMWDFVAFAVASVVSWLAIVRQTTQAEGRYLLVAGAAWATLLVVGSARLRWSVWLWPVLFAVLDVFMLATMPGNLPI